MKRIVYMMPDGVLRIVIPALDAMHAGETEEQFLKRVRDKDVPKDATSVRVVDEAQIPQDRTFRGAWRDTGAKIDCDMPKARNLMRDMLRTERARRFKALDAEWMKAVGSGDKALERSVEQRRAKLRDWPADPRIESCASEGELKALLEAMRQEG